MIRRVALTALAFVLLAALVFEYINGFHDAANAIATVVSTWGSAPRPRGSHMIVAADGRFEGSVSGGCVEGDVLATAAEVIASGKAVRRRYGVADGKAWAVGLPCGGEIEVMLLGGLVQADIGHRREVAFREGGMGGGALDAHRLAFQGGLDAGDALFRRFGTVIQA